MDVKGDYVLEGFVDEGMWKWWKIMKCAAEQRTAVDSTRLYFGVSRTCSDGITILCRKTKLHWDFNVALQWLQSSTWTAMLLNWVHFTHDLLIFSMSVLRSCSLITLSTFSLAFAWTNKLSSLCCVSFLIYRICSCRLEKSPLPLPGILLWYKTLHISQIQDTIHFY